LTRRALDLDPATKRLDDLLEQVAAYALATAVPEDASTSMVFGLRPREADVPRLVAAGLSDARIAERLVVSPHTVGTHLRAVYGKLGVTSRAAAPPRHRERAGPIPAAPRLYHVCSRLVVRGRREITGPRDALPASTAARTGLIGYRGRSVWSISLPR
jgi:DNA-binding CsgD family transcriptional regulator